MVNPLEFLRSARKKKTEPQEEPPAADAGSSTDEAAGNAAAPAAAPAVAEPAASPAADAAAEPAAQPAAQAAAGALPGDPAAVALPSHQIYAAALKAVGRFFASAKKLVDGETEALPIADVEDVAAHLIAAMGEEETGDQLVALAVGAYPDDERFIVPHSVNVAVLSQRVARQLGIEGQEIDILTIAALVHDVGTVSIPKEVFYKDDSLSNEEWEMMRQRPAFSAQIIAGIGGTYRAVAEIAHQVHERLDGSGYPRGLNVEGIAVEASILGAVDIFEAFIHPRPYKKTVPAAAMYGVDNLMRMSHQFGDGVLKALVRSVGLFPVGTFVRLNSGEVARVLKGRSTNPMRPQVEVVFDTQKRRLTEARFIDLMATPHLYVFKPMSPEDMTEYGPR